MSEALARQAINEFETRGLLWVGGEESGRRHFASHAADLPPAATYDDYCHVLRSVVMNRESKLYIDAYDPLGGVVALGKYGGAFWYVKLNASGLLVTGFAPENGQKYVSNEQQHRYIGKVKP